MMVAFMLITDARSRTSVFVVRLCQEIFQICLFDLLETFQIFYIASILFLSAWLLKTWQLSHPKAEWAALILFSTCFLHVGADVRMLPK